jgi:diguanylate cyclase (GGDEF)-like protein
MKVANRISWQLLKSVLSIYFSITIVVTLVQMGIEYRHTRNMIHAELARVEQTFYPALSSALWELNYAQLRALQQGLVDLPLITAVKVVDAKGQELLKSEAGPSKDVFGEISVKHRFKVSYRFSGEDVYLAEVTFVTSRAVVLERLEVGFKMILVSALIKSAALVLLFFWVFRRLLGEPLERLIAAVSSIDLASLGNRRIDLRQKKTNELSQLERAFNNMLGALDAERKAHDASLEKLNKSLEAQVVKRTEELAEANRRLEQLVRTDALTGIANRRYFVEQAEVEIERTRRGNLPLSLLMIDLDHFKNINDTWGHASGDAVLQNFAEVAAGSLRVGDQFARLGGEEFSILLPNTTAEGAQDVAQRIVEVAREQSVARDGNKIRYTVSIGVATLRENENLDVMMSRADAAMYRAKQAGRDRVVIE